MWLLISRLFSGAVIWAGMTIILATIVPSKFVSSTLTRGYVLAFHTSWFLLLVPWVWLLGAPSQAACGATLVLSVCGVIGNTLLIAALVNNISRKDTSTLIYTTPYIKYSLGSAFLLGSLVIILSVALVVGSPFIPGGPDTLCVFATPYPALEICKGLVFIYFIMVLFINLTVFALPLDKENIIPLAHAFTVLLGGLLMVIAISISHAIPSPTGWMSTACAVLVVVGIQWTFIWTCITWRLAVDAVTCKPSTTHNLV